MRRQQTWNDQNRDDFGRTMERRKMARSASLVTIIMRIVVGAIIITVTTILTSNVSFLTKHDGGSYASPTRNIRSQQQQFDSLQALRRYLSSTRRSHQHVSLTMNRHCADKLLIHKRNDYKVEADDRAAVAAATIKDILRACVEQPQNDDHQDGLPLVLVQLRGEMGNHLSTIAHGIGIQIWLQLNYNVTTGLVLLHQMVDQSQQRNSRQNGGKIPTKRWVDHPNFRRTKSILQECFPFLRNMNFDLGMPIQDDPNIWMNEFFMLLDDRSIHDVVEERRTQVLNLARRIHNVNGANPQQWVLTSSSIYDDSAISTKSAAGSSSSSSSAAAALTDKRRVPITTELIDDGLSAAIDLYMIRRAQRQVQKHIIDNGDDNNFLLYSDSMDNKVLVERYKAAFQTLFQVDTTNPKCCRQYPHHNEHVFHYRNFGLELMSGNGRPDSIKQNSRQAPTFEEVTPEQLYDLLHQQRPNLRRGDKIAIVTRRRKQGTSSNAITYLDPSNDIDPSVQRFVSYLSDQHGLDVRVIEGQSGIQDFCFIQHLQGNSTFIGPTRSTFSEWGAILGIGGLNLHDASKSHVSATLYAIHSHALEARYRPYTLQFFDDEYIPSSTSTSSSADIKPSKKIRRVLVTPQSLASQSSSSSSSLSVRY